MNVLLSFTLGIVVLGSTHLLDAEVNRGKDLGVKPEFIAEEYEPPSRGRSDDGIGGDTRFGDRPLFSLIS